MGRQPSYRAVATLTAGARPRSDATLPELRDTAATRVLRPRGSRREVNPPPNGRVGKIARRTATLDRDPRIPDSLEIAVAADDGIVALRGTVESFSQRRAAAQDAKKVDGVYDVDNQLKVSLTGANRREDDEIRGAALQILIWDVEVPSDFVDVKVDDGWLTLKGNVSYQFESDAAYDDVASLYGVFGVTNEIIVSNP